MSVNYTSSSLCTLAVYTCRERGVGKHIECLWARRRASDAVCLGGVVLVN